MCPTLVLEKSQSYSFSISIKTLKTYLVVFVVMLSGVMGFAQEESCACCTENHRAFDFLVGTWQVTNPDGSPAGTNTIVKSEGD